MNLPPPPEDLQSFYEAERAVPTMIDAAAQARMLERVRSIAEISAPVAAATVWTIGAKAAAAIAALSFVAGGVVGHVATRASIPVQVAPEPVLEPDADALVVESHTEPEPEPEATEAEPETAEAPAAEAELRPLAEGEGAEGAREQTAQSTRPQQDLSRERRLLDSASAAIARERWTEAGRALARHGRAYPRGALVEEREALHVRVAFEEGRFNAAERLAERFLLRFSSSLYAPRVRRLQQRAREQAHATQSGE